MTVFGAVEAGGTKFVCAVGTGPDDIRERVRIDTTSPGETLEEVAEFFAATGPVDAVGIATFGPVELRQDHPKYGFITTTPKPNWSDADLVGPISSATGAPVVIETDVTGAALGEWRWGAGKGLRNIIYVTVGTGIGGGVLIDGRPVPGMVHPEMGHVVVTRQPDDGYEGGCPFHGDCLEGMASGPAIAARWGRPGQDLGDLTARAVDLEARYLASGFRSLVYTLAPERIIVGGGVSELPGLLDRVRAYLLEDMNGYALQPEHQSEFVVPPGLGSNAGLAGAMALAQLALGPL
jgi:fructokinase